MFKKAQWQLTIVYTLVLIGILIISNVMLYLVLVNYNSSEMAKDVERITSKIQSSEWVLETEESKEYHNEEDEDEEEDERSGNLNVDDLTEAYEIRLDDDLELFIPEILNSFSYYFIYDEDDVLVRYKSSNDLLLDSMNEISEDIKVGDEPIAIDMTKQNAYHYIAAKYPIIINGQVVGTYTVIENVSIAFDTLDNLRAIMYAVIIIGSVISLGIGYGLAGLSMRPIKQAYKTKQRFVGDASHELRTPISVIMLSMEAIKNYFAPSDEGANEIIDDVIDEARNMKKLVGKLLFLARNDSGSVVFRKDHIYMNKLVQKNVKKYRLIGQEKGITFEEDYSSHRSIIGDEKLIDSVISTLCDNAIKYNKPDGKVYVTVNEIMVRRKHYVEVTVKDTGIGIDEDDISKVFERFHRQDTSRNKKIEGYGLGLSIAKVIVESHNGEIDVESELGIGTTFGVRLPLK
ncbi:HAMP domain-containing histidine kinase [Vallitalea pronyensis]|uniref:histidine kinase n=1 Tax=Vallitalea pronyensis TaxID=1348613 RepID=A0A8J8MGN1_9FIRM|nr:HAMP domain-containing sensor histidine kinase [Vallitalea pronyensis]QUI21305.1 HAMP domain-containing histidine kinase [Vallitalea pronyensis]